MILVLAESGEAVDVAERVVGSGGEKNFPLSSVAQQSIPHA
jgi:hypothetical protein